MSSTSTQSLSTSLLSEKNNDLKSNNIWKRGQIFVKTKNDNFFRNKNKLTKANLEKINKFTVCNNKHCYYCDRTVSNNKNKIVCAYLDTKSDMSSITTNDSSENSSEYLNFSEKK